MVGGEGLGGATPAVDFLNLQPVRTITFPPFVFTSNLLFQISDDEVPEIAESFHVVLLEDTVVGDAVLVPPNAVHVTIEPNDKPHGVLSIGSGAVTRPVSINEDLTRRWVWWTLRRSGGGGVSFLWTRPLLL